MFPKPVNSLINNALKIRKVKSEMDLGGILSMGVHFEVVNTCRGFL